MEENLAELRNEVIKAKDSPKTRKSEYYNQIKNIRDKINRLEKKSLHVDDEPILPEDILMTDEHLNTICFNEDYLKAYVIAMRFLPMKVKIVRVLWYLKNGKAEFRRSLKINKDNYVPFSIPLITGENVTCKVNLRSFYEASDIEKVLKKMFMIYEGKEEPIDKIDFDIVDNGMEEEVENGNENTMAAIEDKDEDEDEDEDDDYETPEATKERKKEESRKKKEALQQQRELLQRDKDHEISVEDYLRLINGENGSSSYKRSKRDDDDDKIDYNPPFYYGLIASLYDLYTLRYPRQKKWKRPFSDDKENRPIINTIVEYRRRKIVKKNRSVSGEKAIDKTRKLQMGDDIMGEQSL